MRWGPDGVSHPEAAFSLPVGTVTFVLTDVEGSTRLWSSEDPELVRRAIGRHYVIVADAVARHGGVRPQEQGEGDSIVAAFARPSDALAAVLDAQSALHAERWPTAEPVRVRMAVHTGEAQLRDDANYAGQAIIRTARLRALGHGGQVLVSGATRDLALDQAGDRFAFRSLGEHELRDLARSEHVYQLLDPGLPGDFPPLRSGVVKHNLPVNLSPFIGRVSEIVTVAGLVRRERLVSVVGSGGAGKTRLSQQVAAELLDDFVGGVVWVELAPVDAAGVAQAVRDGFGIVDRHGASLSDDVRRAVDGRPSLLVVDNCEHVNVAAADVISGLLAAVPTLNVLATSRTALDVPGERTWRVPPLSLPARGANETIEALSQYDAVQLFCDRAGRARPNFRLTADNGPSIAELAHRLDGMPLALELAAARVRTLSPQQILDGIGDVFRLLTGGSRTVLPRQQTLEASIMWSYELLDAREQRLLRHLSVFSGGCTLDSAEAVCADDDLPSALVLDALDRLVDHSLVQVIDGDEHRYLLLETVRQFADRALTAEDRAAVRSRHAAHFAATATRLAGLATTMEVFDHLDRSLLDEDDLVRAIVWFVEHDDAATAAQMIVDLDPVMWLAGRHAITRRAIASVLAMPSTGDRHAHLLYLDAVAAVGLGDFATGLARVDECALLADRLGDRLNSARAAGYRQILRVSTGAAPLDTVDAFADRLDDVGDPWLAARLRVGAMGLTVGLGAGRGELRRRLAAIEGSPMHDDPRANQMLANGRMALAMADCDVERLVALVWSTLERRHSMTNAQGGAASMLVGFLPYLGAETADRAVRVLDGLARIDGNVWFENLRDGAIAARHVLDDRPELAVASLERALRAPILAARMNASTITALLAAGIRLDGIDGALSVDVHVWGPEEARLRGDVTTATARAHELLARSAAGELRFDALVTLDSLAVIEADAGRTQDAARLVGAVDAAMTLHGIMRPPSLQRRRDRAMAKAVETLGAEETERARAEGASLELWEAVEYAQRRRSAHSTATVGWEALTPTEAKVAALVAEGKTNPQVAKALLMSPATVKTHLGRVFAKLGVTNRQQLVLAASRRNTTS
jgi:predicted ATPase/class 3 adenylate cyclase/DNA-binding CsgD family transcriptional regulator